MVLETLVTFLGLAEEEGLVRFKGSCGDLDGDLVDDDLVDDDLGDLGDMFLLFEHQFSCFVFLPPETQAWQCL